MEKPVSLHKIWQNSTYKIALVGGVIGLVIGLGWMLLSLSTKADTTTTASFQAEAGAGVGVATVVDSSAASGEAIQFGVGRAAGSCALPAYPDAGCTGVPSGTALAVMDLPQGYMDITVAGTVIDGKDIRGCLIIRAPNITIRNSKISCANYSVIYSVRDYYTGGGLLLEDVEISCNGTQGTGVSDYGFTIRRANIHSCENGFSVGDSVTIEDSYVHDLIPYNPLTDPHIDGLQSYNGSNVTINHNTIDGGPDGNAAININNSAGGPTTSNATISNNLLAGGGYTLYCPIPTTVNFKILNNRFSRKFHPNSGAFGPSTDCGDEIQSGNVWDDTGSSLSLP